MQVFEEYFKDLQEETIRSNYVIIYELFDEMMDFGYPQITDTKILQRCARCGDEGSEKDTASKTTKPGRGVDRDGRGGGGEELPG